ncbi:MAG: MBL fold metallo-hydrolase, partial [Sulfurovum sp.]
AWQYLGDHLDGSARLQIKAHNVNDARKTRIIYKRGDISIKAVSVHHGPIPAVAYRVNIGNKSITFSGDMNGDYHTLEILAKSTDILVAHNAVPKGTTGVAANLHMTPSIIGQIAQKAQPKRVILSHRMLRTLGREKETLSEIHKHYTGSVKFANDKSYYRVK